MRENGVLFFYRTMCSIRSYSYNGAIVWFPFRTLETAQLAQHLLLKTNPDWPCFFFSACFFVVYWPIPTSLELPRSPRPYKREKKELLNEVYLNQAASPPARARSSGSWSQALVGNNHSSPFWRCASLCAPTAVVRTEKQLDCSEVSACLRSKRTGRRWSSPSRHYSKKNKS